MNERTTTDLGSELHDVFHVRQLTRGTFLEDHTAADIVDMHGGVSSQTHRHNLAETVLYFLDGEAVVFVEDVPHRVTAGDRLLIGKGEFHSVSTTDTAGCRFLSVQSPPILNKTTGLLDLEPRLDEPAIANLDPALR